MRKRLLTIAGAIAVSLVGALLAILTTPEAPPEVSASASADSSSGGPSVKAVPAPPRLSATKKDDQPVDTRPSSPRYDPIRLALALSPREVFDHEPRDARWAPAMEQRLLPDVQRDLGGIPGIQDIQIDCRTSACRFSWRSADKKAAFNAGSLAVALWGGGGGGRVTDAYIAIFRGSHFEDIDPTNPDQLAQRLKELRMENLKNHRKRYAEGRPRYAGLPLESWPEN